MSIAEKLRQTASRIDPWDDGYTLAFADLRDLLEDAAMHIEKMEARERKRGYGINNTPAVFLNTSGEQIT